MKLPVAPLKQSKLDYCMGNWKTGFQLGMIMGLETVLRVECKKKLFKSREQKTKGEEKKKSHECIKGYWRVLFSGDRIRNKFEFIGMEF